MHPTAIPAVAPVESPPCYFIGSPVFEESGAGDVVVLALGDVEVAVDVL